MGKNLIRHQNHLHHTVWSDIRTATLLGTPKIKNRWWEVASPWMDHSYRGAARSNEQYRLQRPKQHVSPLATQQEKPCWYAGSSTRWCSTLFQQSRWTATARRALHSLRMQRGSTGLSTSRVSNAKMLANGLPTETFRKHRVQLAMAQYGKEDLVVTDYRVAARMDDRRPTGNVEDGRPGRDQLSSEKSKKCRGQRVVKGIWWRPTVAARGRGPRRADKAGKEVIHRAWDLLESWSARTKRV